MTISATVDRWNPNPYVLSKAARIINAGGLVAFPTETVYGLGADALNPEAVSKIFTAKGRPQDNPLILHVWRITQAYQVVEFNDAAERLMNVFWPGPLTIVLPAKDIVPSITRGGLPTAAVRMPDNVTALTLIYMCDNPLAAPSANISGKPSPTDADTVYKEMNGKIDMIVDGGSVTLGIESTVIDMTDPSRPLMLRPGGMPREVIEKELGMKLEIPDNVTAKRSPGTHYRHYAPSVPVIIWKKGKKLPPDCAYMGIDTPEGVDRKKAIIFDSLGNYARGLFSGFRKFENDNVSCIAVQWPEYEYGLSEGLRDRILRSAGLV